MRMAGVHIILAVVYEIPLDVLMYNEKKSMVLESTYDLKSSSISL